MTYNSLVSVCIPTFNGEQFIKEALNSILDQTYQNIEVLISDDNSSDRTLEIAQEFSEKCRFPVEIIEHQPSGIGANWNNCLKHSNGKYIKFLFQDDILTPTCIEEMVEVIKENREVGLVSCKRDLLFEESGVKDNDKWRSVYGDLQKQIQMTPYKKDVLLINNSLFGSKHFLRSPLNKIGEPSAVFFEKELIQTVGCFREDLDQILDYEFFYRILKVKKVAIITKPLVKFRIHSNQATKRNFNKSPQEKLKYERILLRDFFWYLSLQEKIRLIKKFYLSW